MSPATKYMLFLFACTLFVIGYLYLRTEKHTQPVTESTDEVSPAPVRDTCIPTFADGGGPYYLPNAPMRTNIAPPNSNGETLVVQGKVLRSDCQTPLSNGTLDIWQADESGKYQNEWYRGKINTDAEGNYSFQTVIPKGYGEGTGYRPPHIHFKVFEGSKEIITSQMFFPDVTGRTGFDDAYIMKVEKKEENGKPVNYGYHDIILP